MIFLKDVAERSVKLFNSILPFTRNEEAFENNLKITEIIVSAKLKKK